MNTEVSKANQQLLDRLDALLSELPRSACSEEHQIIRERLLKWFDPPSPEAFHPLGSNAVEALLNASSDAAFLIDTKGVFLAANAELARRLGLESPSLIGRCCYDLIPPEVAARRKLWVDQVLRTKAPVTEDDQRGTSLVRNCLYPVFDSRGNVTAIAIYGRDITEREAARKALEHSRESYEAVFNASSDCIFIHDGNTGEIIDVNRSAEEAFGYTLEEMKKLDVGDMTVNEPPYTRREAFEHFQKAVVEGPQKFEWLAKSRSGKLIWFENSLLYTSLAGQDSMLVTGRDITQRKEAEERYQNITTEMEGILNSLPDAVIYADTERVIRKVNPAFTRIFGYQPGEVIGKSTRLIYRSEQEFQEQGRARYNKNASEMRSPYEIFYVRKDGTQFITETVGTPVRNARGDVVGLLALIRDITGQKQMQERMRQMEKMESVGRLAGGVAHDFNNMLNVILGHTEMAIEKLDTSDPLRGDLEEVKKAGERSANLTKQLLAFARRQTIAPVVLDLNQTISSMLKMLERLIGESIELIWKPGSDLASVNIDPGQVDQMLANLAINARDAIGHNPGRVSIETASASFSKDHCSAHPGYTRGDYVILEVSDNGCGMDEETRLHIFEPFYTTKEGGQGTGLGLSTVYGIVTQNGGFINVCSEPGQGTTFRIYLPHHTGKELPHSIKTPGILTRRGSETVLLVEDEPSILKMVTMMLEMEGYKVLPAGSPGEAIRMAREHSGEIHLVVSDVVMPEMNGRDLARNILSLYPMVKRLFMSGYTADVIAHHGVLDEGVNFIQKPFSRGELAAKIREMLDRD
jgi:two-component system, cell cycle sensor histidine kinase and response regulator CckA